ncbi:MAG: cupin domain-containing protein [Elusimicrobiota bacterium]
MINVLKEIPYRKDKMGNRVVADTDEAQIMQLALKPGQKVPEHKANSNVHILVLEGAITADFEGKDKEYSTGSLIPVDFKTPMRIKNKGDKKATFLVIKTPHPKEMKK